MSTKVLVSFPQGSEYFIEAIVSPLQIGLSSCLQVRRQQPDSLFNKTLQFMLDLCVGNGEPWCRVVVGSAHSHLTETATGIRVA